MERETNRLSLYMVEMQDRFYRHLPPETQTYDRRPIKNMNLAALILLFLLTSISQSTRLVRCAGPVSTDPTAGKKSSAAMSSLTLYPDRRLFADKIAKVQDGDTKQQVEELLGKPQDFQHAPDPVPYPTDEIWCYGSEGHLSLPTLGQVCFREGHVIWVAGGHDTPPGTSVITEEDLRAGMRFMHPGPEVAGYNDPLHLIRVVNYLQPQGKEKALAIIGEYARISNPAVDTTWVFLLLRTLFDIPNPPGWMPEMYIGAMSPQPPKDRSRIPRFPLIIMEDIPFSALWGVMLAGEAEPVSIHVEYFRKHGTLRAKRLHPPDDPFLAFKELLASKEWATVREAEKETRRVNGYEGHTLLQVLHLVRTAYDPPEARQPFASPEPTDYDRYHQAFLRASVHWDESLQMYVRADGSHGKIGHLANIYKYK